MCYTKLNATNVRKNTIYIGETSKNLENRLSHRFDFKKQLKM